MRKICVLLENPIEPINVGCVMRNIYAFDSGKLYVPMNAPLNRKIKSACGTGEKVTIQKLKDVQKFLDETNHRKIGFIVAEHDEKFSSVNLTDTDKERNVFKFNDGDLLIFGNEKLGLSEETKNKCNVLLSVPMLGHMACLNVAVTTGIVLYEVLRQKIGKGSVALKKKKKKEDPVEKVEWWMKEKKKVKK